MFPSVTQQQLSFPVVCLQSCGQICPQSAGMCPFITCWLLLSPRIHSCRLDKAAGQDCLDGHGLEIKTLRLRETQKHKRTLTQRLVGTRTQRGSDTYKDTQSLRETWRQIQRVKDRDSNSDRLRHSVIHRLRDLKREGPHSRDLKRLEFRGQPFSSCTTVPVSTQRSQTGGQNNRVRAPVNR